MIAKQFIKENHDILLKRITEEEYQSLTDGTVLFCITVAKGNAPSEERAVRTVGYQMVVATNTAVVGEPEKLEDVVTLTLTTNGYAKVDYITPGQIGPNGTKLLFYCKPLPGNDPRRNHRWLQAMKEVL